MEDQENPEIVGTEVVAPQDDGTVELHLATREDIDAALKTAQDEERAQLESENSASTGNTPPPAVTNPAPSGPAQTATQADPSKPAGTASAQTPAKQGEVQGTQTEIERLRKQGEQKELYIQHQGNAIGRLRTELATTRQQLLNAKTQLTNGLEQRFAENPVKASEDRDKIKEIDAELAGIDERDQRSERALQAQTYFLRHVDIEKVQPDDIANMLRNEGMPEQYITSFKANPWEFTSPEALVELGKRAMVNKDYSQADSDRRLLAKHVLYLNDQLKQAQAKPGQVMKTVQKHLNQSPTVTAASAASKSSANALDPSRVPFLSNAELNAALKNATAN